jgi:hypothetical protein
MDSPDDFKIPPLLTDDQIIKTESRCKIYSYLEFEKLPPGQKYPVVLRMDRDELKL